MNAENIESTGNAPPRGAEQDYPIPPPPAEAPALDGRALLGQPQRFFNRELSWLAFNRRVLEEARNTRHPLFERLRFLSIAANNQEEFFMVRVAGLKHKIKRGAVEPGPDGLTPQQQLEAIGLETADFADDLRETWDRIRQDLETEGVAIVRPGGISEAEAEKLTQIFMAEIFPALTPVTVDRAIPFPFIPNKGVALAFRFGVPGGKTQVEALTVLPSKLPRFIKIPGGKPRYVLLEDLVVMNIGRLFPDPLKLLDCAAFRVLRDSELEVDEDAEDLMANVETAIKRRRRGNVIRLTVNDTISPPLLDFLKRNLQVHDYDVLYFGDLIGMADLKDLITHDRPELLFKPYNPRHPQRIRDFDGDCFAAIKNKDIVVHHPYESFDIVVDFVNQAARDPEVIAIKQTIYRTSHKSPVIRALIEAAENGKSVTAVVELKARFDEEANLRWARDMEKAGVQVVYGFRKLKTHAKVTLVTRREGKRMVSYAHFGTGNYHPDTAKVYADLSFFTCDRTLCEDAMALFNYMTTRAAPKEFQRLAIAPLTMRQTLKSLINAEIEAAKAGQPAQIWLKCNSLADPEIIDHLYKASRAGVDIDLVIRGICTLRPGIPGLSEKIRVWSVVGRYLEHARIYCFANGQDMPSPKGRVFIASGDIMPRNLDHRIETMVEITNPTVHRQVLDQIMVANLKDQAQSWLLQADGAYSRVPAGDDAFSAHGYFMKNSSLSGRGKDLSAAPMPPALELDRRRKK
ncbi:MAG TPA: RNA degradosome polyphosphate kinase [Patescibacteria group bacterium]|nr:RNA degradosome polyphosphate kinase [Patescibacteria group bacterium]